MKNIFSFIFGISGALITTLFGGWNGAMTTLVIMMGTDYILGLIAAGVFHKSKKSATGRLESQACWKGLARKFVTLMIVALAYRIDLLIGTTYLKDAVILAYCANEGLSIIENAGLMGVPIPQKIVDAMEILKNGRKEQNT